MLSLPFNPICRNTAKGYIATVQVLISVFSTLMIDDHNAFLSGSPAACQLLPKTSQHISKEGSRKSEVVLVNREAYNKTLRPWIALLGHCDFTRKEFCNGTHTANIRSLWEVVTTTHHWLLKLEPWTLFQGSWATRQHNNTEKCFLPIICHANLLNWKKALPPQTGRCTLQSLR